MADALTTGPGDPAQGLRRFDRRSRLLLLAGSGITAESVVRPALL